MIERIVRSWRAVIVLTRNDGVEPTIEDVEVILKKSGLAFGMPGQQEAPIVISINDGGVELPIRAKVLREEIKE